MDEGAVARTREASDEIAMSWKYLAAALALSTMIGGCHQAHAEPEKVGVYGLEGQIVSGARTVRAKGGGLMDRIDILVTVDTAGKVVDARIDTNRSGLDPAPALEAARNWRFRPQTFDGKPVFAVGSVPVSYKPLEDKPDPGAAIPQSDPADTEVVLARTACYGTCPDYQVSVRGDGLVRFTTRQEGKGAVGDVYLEFQGAGVLIPGLHEVHIEPAAAQALIARFRTAGFFGLKQEYAAGITDQPTQILVYRAGKTVRKLTDYAGDGVGMPDTVTELEEAVDRVAGSERWVDGNADTIAWLADRGFDFRSAAAGKLALAALQKLQRYSRPTDVHRVTTMILAMADRGLSLEQSGVGASLARLAASSGDEALFEQFRQKGFVARMKRADLDAAFGSGAGCSGPIARALAAAGANPKAKGSWDGNALHAMRGDLGSPCDGRDATRIAEAAQALIALGVPIEGRDGLGWTPLMGAEYPEVAQSLIAHGANVNAHDHDGAPPLLTTSDDRVALTLLRAGADPHARNKDGSVRYQATKWHMPATLAWLDAHGIAMTAREQLWSWLESARRLL
jgi:hypothetical protein